eukprot:Awhi_evm1s11964
MLILYLLCSLLQLMSTNANAMKSEDPIPTGYASYTFFPSEFSLYKGKITEPFDGNMNEVQRLQTIESTLGMTLEMKNVESGVYMFDSNQTLKGLDFLMTFNVGSKRSIRTVMSSISLTTRFIGSQGDWNAWQFFVKNFDTNQDELLASNLLANDWVWSDLTGNITFANLDSSYMTEEGEIEVRYLTNGPPGTFDTSALDSVELRINVNEKKQTSTSKIFTTLTTDAPVPTSISTYKFYPTKFSLGRGKVIEPFDGNLNEVQRLKTQESTLGMTLEQKNVEAGVYIFDSNQTIKGLDFRMTFNLGSNLSIRDAITSMSFKATFMGSQGDWNVWQFFVKNFDTNEEELLTSNLLANDWVWSDLSGTKLISLGGSYVNVAGEIIISFVTNGPVGTFDASALDFIQLTVNTNEGQPTTTSAPAATTVPSDSVPTVFTAYKFTPTKLVLSK